MGGAKKNDILDNTKVMFKDVTVQNHVNNKLKLSAIKEFNLNPFLYTSFANYLTGSNESESIAKSLIYFRVLGASVVILFGQNFQSLCIKNTARINGFSYQ